MSADEMKDTRLYIAKHPYERGHSGKGLLSPTGNLITWRTHGSGHEWGDGHPWHREAAIALGYMPAKPIPTKETKHYVGDMIAIDPKGQIDSYMGNPKTPRRI